MKISSAAKNTILIMMSLATQYDVGHMKLDTIAKQLGVSRSYLENQVRLLSIAGLISSKNGAGGGYMLVNRPDKITLADIYEAVHGKIDLRPCLNEPEDCENILVCENIKAWAKVSSAIQSKLEEIKLSDLSGTICFSEKE